jgi:hypothetical protein
MTEKDHANKPAPEAAATPRGQDARPQDSRRPKVVSRQCDRIEDLDRLDRMRRELFEADAARWETGSRTKDDLTVAFGYWIGYPMFLESVGHDWHTDQTRTAAYYALNFAHTQATRVLMEEAEKQGLDPHALYECARVVEEIYADAPEKYYAGLHDTWPDCMGAARYSLPAGQQEALRAGEAVFVRLAVKAGIDRTVKPSLPATVGTGKEASKPSRADRVWSKPYCPSCGAPDLEWVTREEFAKRASIKKPSTVGDRVNDGKYWTRADKCVPWCKICQAGTPEGSGDVAPQIAYEPSLGDIEQITAWAYEALKPFGLQKHLPGLNRLKGFEPDARKYGQQLAYECLEEAVTAIYVLANDRKDLPTRDEAVSAATDAIREKRGDDIANIKQTGHDMDQFSRPQGSGRGRRAIAEPEDTEDPAEN